MRIQHNIPAMTAYRNYSNNVSSVQKNLERLSSGYKINRAGDDAAGLAISEKMRAQITGLEVAQKNAKDGISLVQTAEGALTEVHDMLNRMFELSEQSANGTYQDEVDRENLQKELGKLRIEIDRIADSSNFNGINLLDGSMESKLVTSGEKQLITQPTQILLDGQMGKKEQAGVFSIDLSNLEIKNTSDAGDSPEEMTLKFKIFNTEDLEFSEDKIAAGEKVSGEDVAKLIAKYWNKRSADANATDGGRKISGAVLTAEANGSKVTFTMDKAPTSEWKTKATTGKFSNDGGTMSTNQAEEVTVTVEKEPVDNTQQRMYAQAQFDLKASDLKDGTTIKIGDTSYIFAIGAESKFKDAGNVIDLTDMELDGLTKKMGIVGQRLSEAAKDNRNFKVGTTTVADTADTSKTVITVTEREGGVDYAKNNLAGKDGVGGKAKEGKNVLATVDDWKGLITMGAADSSGLSKGLILQIGDTADAFNQMKVSVSDCHADAMGIGDIDISTQTGAADAMKKIKDAINYVSDVRGTLGATQNRLDHTINNLSVMQENIQDAESTIRDVDVAKEMMEYTKNNILVQSAQAMLAQANQLPQGVLQLLG